MITEFATVVAMMTSAPTADPVPVAAPAAVSAAPLAPPPSPPVDSAAPVAPVASPVDAGQPVPPGDASPAAVAPSMPPAATAGDDQTIVVTGHLGADPGDPAQAINQVSFEAVQAVDKAIIAPITHGYMAGVPKVVRGGVHNFINNLDEPIVFVNFLLQLNPGKAAETAGRFVVNSTLGLLGIMDVAKKKPFNLPRRSNGLADTLGYYGVGPGPYLFLPLIGSTTIRDGLGRIIDLSLLPFAVGKPFNRPEFGLPKAVLSALDERAEYDADLKRLRASPDPYRAVREFYLNRRQAEIDVLRALGGRKRKPEAQTPTPESVPAASVAVPAPAVP